MIVNLIFTDLSPAKYILLDQLDALYKLNMSTQECVLNHFLVSCYTSGLLRENF